MANTNICDGITDCITDGICVFWYCNIHDDGCIAFYPKKDTLEKDTLEKDTIDKDIYRLPECINLCYPLCPINTRNINCLYTKKGIIKIKDNKIIEIAPLQLSFEREAGGFEFLYYLKNIIDINQEKEINECNIAKLLMKWHYSK